MELGAPAMKLTRVIEGAKGSEPLYQRHLNSVGMLGGRATEDHGVVFFDLAGSGPEGYKFIPY